MHLRKYFLQALYTFFVIFFSKVLSTEISEGSSNIYQYLGLEISLPTLLCHPRISGYKKVIWMKDHLMVKKGSADQKSHILSLESLLEASLSPESLLENSLDELNSPFKLQGYYTCLTDNSTLGLVHPYLFQIPNIYTFVGKLVARNDSLGDDHRLTYEDKVAWKKRVIENEMESILFRDPPNTNVSVSNIEELKEGGLEVDFYLYVRSLVDPRKKPDTGLVEDEEHFHDIMHNLKTGFSSTDGSLMYLTDWIKYLGIRMEDFDLRSTLGCYKEDFPEASNTTEKVSWPSARIGDVVMPDNACLTKDGLAVTRLCTGSFHTGAKWGMPSGNCERPPNDITLKLKNLSDNYGRTDISSKVEKLVELTEHPSALDVSDLHILADILNLMSKTRKLSEKETSGIMSVIDKTMEANQTELIAAKNIVRLTSRLLEIFDNILKEANDEEREIQIAKKHLIVETKFIEEINTHNLILGLAVMAPNNHDGNLYDGSVEFLMSQDRLPKRESIAHFSLPRKLVEERAAQQDIPRQVNMVFFQNWNLFQNPKDVLVKRNYRVLPTPVMYVSVSGGPAWNLTDPIQLYFKDTVKGVLKETPVCVFYDARLDYGNGAWSSEGCEYQGLKNGYYHCQCHHLSIFAVILSKPPYSEPDLNLGTSVYVGCSVSILALSFSVLLFILSKNWRKTVDHCILFCLSLTYLVCIIIIFISEMHFKGEHSCTVLSMLFHYTIFATFGWLMVLAITYRLRFAMRTDFSEIPQFMIKAGFSVWGTPVIIVIVMWFTRDFTSLEEHSCIFAIDKMLRISVIPIIILVSVTLCINLCATYSLTCRYRKDFLVNDSDYSDIVVKFRVSFTIFFFFALCWLFGFLAAFYRSKTLKILFSITMTLTAYYVSLFFIFQEESFWDMCKNCKKKKEEEPVAQYDNKSYKSDGETVVKNVDSGLHLQ